ncbi:MAG: RHS repeat protein [Burkholderiales bacterium]|nr:RHS repeat protein [Burkholderiales bacterium]
MKKTFKKYNQYYIVILLLFNFTTISGQGTFGHATPQVSDFIKYGDVPVSLFSGKYEFEIPIYHYQDYDFNIPIRLVYSTEGFKRSKRADLVGLDWTLIASGCITREIYGMPDDFNPYSNILELGYYLAVKDGGFDKEKIWNFDSTIVKKSSAYQSSENSYYYIEKNNAFVDFSPDLFMFNFNGHTGNFMIDHDGTAKSMDRSYKVDISNLKAQSTEVSNSLDFESSIRITSPDGYSYIFGGHFSNIEYTISFKDGHSNNDNMNPTIIAWHLAKIIAPNGREVQINYVKHSGEDVFSDVTSPFLQTTHAEVVNDNNGVPINPILRTGSATKKSVLESIVIDDVEIEFNNVIEQTLNNFDNRFFQHVGYFNAPIYQLNNISVKKGDDVIFQFNLFYENVYKRRFLQQLTMADGRKYTFLYNHPEAYPDPDNTLVDQNTDFYGFWTQNNQNSSYGLLKQVTYPTGGNTKFAYEKHTFSKEAIFFAATMDKHLISGSNQYLDTIRLINPIQHEHDSLNIIIDSIHYAVTQKYRHNGARIQQITNCKHDNTVIYRKVYKYTTETDNENSSGILYQSPPVVGVHVVTGERIYAGGNIWHKNYNIDEQAIGYSSVFEIFADGSHKKYIFSDWNYSPDNITGVKLQFVNGNSSILSELDNSFLVLTGHSRIASASDKRGRVMEIEYLTNNKLSSKVERFEYLNLNNSIIPIPHDSIVPEKDFIVSFQSMKGGAVVKKIYLDKFHPKTLHYNSEEGVISETRIKYNDFDMLKSSLLKVHNEEYLTEYTYPFDYNDQIFKNMTVQNLISAVIEEKLSNIKQPTQELRHKKTEYIPLPNNQGLSNSQFLPEKIWLSIGNAGFRLVTKFDVYDSFGKLCQKTSIDGIPTTYLWFNHNHFPIAEIKNATYQSVINYPTTSADELRNLLPYAHITTFTYEPLVGLKSITDPRGVKTTFEYDNSNRLEFIKDHNNNRVKSYSYKYIHEVP